MAKYICPYCKDVDFSYNNGKCMRCGTKREADNADTDTPAKRRKVETIIKRINKAPKRYIGDELRVFKAFIEREREAWPSITSTTIAIDWAGGSYGGEKYYKAIFTLNYLNRGAK